MKGLGDNMSWFFDWGYVMLAALLLIGSFVWAGFATKIKQMFVWAGMFTVILITVLVAEAISYFFVPGKMTISTAFGLLLSSHPIAAFLILTLWLLFCWFLIVHLVTRKQVGDTK